MFTRYERTIARRYLWPGKGEGIIAIVAGRKFGIEEREGGPKSWVRGEKNSSLLS
jgi:hypothetical protein